MNAQLGANNYHVSAFCPNCKAVTSFVDKGNTQILEGHYSFQGKPFKRLLYVFNACSGCGRAGLAAVYDNGSRQTAALESFFPFSIVELPLPEQVPADIRAEFREVEKCQSWRALRAASALFRSVLEKTLKANGYTKGSDPKLTDLYKRIDAAAAGRSGPGCLNSFPRFISGFRVG